MVTTRTTSVAASTVVALLAPPVAWAAWISWSDGKSGDAQHVAWFATVAVGCVLAGALAPRGARLLWPAAAAVLSTLGTLFLWWSSEDESGLFLVGLIIAAPLVVAASLPLLLLGQALASLGRRG
jgi:MFS-type transporter involved in bile tolerance (Atg22 family)